MQAGQVFNGTATMQGVTLDYKLTVDSVNNNQFTCSQVLSLAGTVMEESQGNGTFSKDGDNYTVVFEDNATNFNAVLNLTDGSFTGNAEQKDGSASGGFNLKLA